MTYKHIYVLFFIILSGCASLKPIEQTSIIKQAIDITQDKNLSIFNIPTHGAIADAIAISANGGKNASYIRDKIVSLSENGGGSILVMSNNPDLSKANIEGALKNYKIKSNNIWLIYAGTPKLTDSVKTTVEAAGIKYGFVNAFQ